MDISVCICTWNRADLLDQTLRGLAAMSVPPDLEWELLVVNNNSSDHTDEVIARHEGVLPLRRLFEPKQGHSNARNCALAAATGEIILWTDDDVLVDPSWLAEVAAAARRWPEASYFGGPIEPWYEEEPPAWVRDHLPMLIGPLVVLDYGPEVRPMTPGETAFGANLAFRANVLKGHSFDPSLGRKGTSLIGYDEYDLMNRLRRSGHTGVWVGTARVRHYIPRRRMSERFVWEWFVADGQSQIRIGARQIGGRRVLGFPPHLVRRYARYRAKSLLRSGRKDDAWMTSFIEAARTLGYLKELRSARERVPAQTA
ncbi:glycosyltransferase [Tautonia sociabilis]|uniref:Glycosyltransferase family 2 protein n=1 Tax=Tautonia sociabilis TaxID=2080755 RepID=A0A432MIZ5_9BACT|nr:glycosyltransferase [Tautonia sociabilis]RUL87168.1 glycosyltransferase family 2 protein [Tautonia sociabilis]